MASTVSWDKLRELAGFRAERGCAISLYLGLDPSVAPTAGDAESRVRSLLAEGERMANASRRDLTHAQREGLKADLERIRRWFDNDFDRAGSRGFAIFAAGLDNAWTTLSLMDPVEDELRIGREFYLAPLVPLVGRGSGVVVAVLNRERGDLYVLRDGRLDEVARHSEEQPRRHDQGGWSQANYQRHVDKLVAEHLRTVADALDRHVRRARGADVVVVGTDELRTEFEEMLPKDTRSAIVGWVSAEAHAGPAELLDAVRPVLDGRRQRKEQNVLDRWREEAGRHGRAAAGWDATLEAASDGRVDLLLYQEGADHLAWQCPECGRASTADGSCPLDGTRMERRDGGLDVAVHQTLAHGGTVQPVRTLRDLDPVEGIGALLRY
jgi:peptide chain release factor subunit 1